MCFASMNGYIKKRYHFAVIAFAEGGGFEPPVPLRVRQFSKLVVSATHPSFLLGFLPNAMQRYAYLATCANFFGIFFC